jgi:hypothetical protein
MAAKISQRRAKELAEKDQIQRGYAAFKAADVRTLRKLLHDDVVWHDVMAGTTKTGKTEVVKHLLGLQAAGTRAELIGVPAWGTTSPISLDVTQGGAEPAHACADKIEFEGELIKTVWHCQSNTHTSAAHGVG